MPEDVIFQRPAQPNQQKQQAPYVPPPPPDRPGAGGPSVEDPFTHTVLTPSITPPSGTAPTPGMAPPPPPPSVPSSPPKIPPAPPGEGGLLASPLVRLVLFIGGGIIFLMLLIFFISRFFQGGGIGGNVTLTYWGLFEDKNVMDAVIADFHRQHPNITVTYSKEDPKQYTDRLVARVPAGTGPDIFRYHNTWTPMLIPLLLPLSSDVISKKDFQQSFYPAAQQDLVRNGALYGIPLEIDTLSLFVNNKILQASGKQPPTTWVEFVDIAKNVTVKDQDHKIKTAGAGIGAYDNVTHAPDILSLMFSQNNCDTKDLTKCSQFAAQALSFYESFATSDQNVWDATLDPTKIAFAKENLAMYFGYSWDIFEIKAMNPTLDFKIYPVPRVLGGSTATIASYWVEGVSSKTKHPAEALLFMHFLSQKETEQKLFSEQAKTRLFGEPYARSDLADSLKTHPYLAAFVNQAKNAQTSIFAGETRQETGIDAQLNGYLGNAIRAGLSGISADSAVSTLAQGVAQVLQQYGH